jgi:anaerobic ribonucleoside-triphosphate reductase activating protein
MDKDYIDGLTLLGGEPFEKVNQREEIKLLRAVKERFPKKNIWAYSGYLFNDIKDSDGEAHCEVSDEFISYIDVLVDGQFKIELKDISLKFRGSSNQRIIDVKKTLASGKVTLISELMD